jgi:transposase
MATKRSSEGASAWQTEVNPDGDKEAHAEAAAPSPDYTIQQLPARPEGAHSACAAMSVVERAQLLEWTRSRTIAHRLVVRSWIVLLAADGLTTREIANRLRISTATVRLWCRRFARSGVAALTRDRPGRGRLPGRSGAVVLAILRAMRHRDRAGQSWSTRSLARTAGTSAATVWRVWKQCGVGPSSTVAEIDRAMAQAISETAHDAD